VITGYFSHPSLSTPSDIYVAYLNNSLLLDPAVANNPRTYGATGVDRPGGLEYVFTGGRSLPGVTTGTRLSTGGYYNGVHLGYILTGTSYNISNSTNDVYVLRFSDAVHTVYSQLIHSASLPGYAKSHFESNSCTPATPSGNCRLAANDLGIAPELLAAKDYYRSSANDFIAQFETDSRNQYAREQAVYYAGMEQLVSNEITGQLLSRSTDTAILYLESSDLLEDKKLLAELYLSAGRLEDCRKVTSNLISASGWRKPELLNATDIEDYQVENAEYAELMYFLLSVFESGRNLVKLTDYETATLEKLSGSYTLTGPKACAYLKVATGKECSYEILNDVENEEVNFKLANPESDPTKIELSAYPNPASKSLNITIFIPENSGKPELTIHDLTGRKQATFELQPALNNIELNTSSYPEGVYLLQVKTSDNVKTLRFTVQK